jgi:putative copper export protein
MLANLNALWCTSYGLVAGFKVMTVCLAMSIGLVNNRLVAAHRVEEELSPAARGLMRRRGPSILTLRRVITAEAGLLLGVVILAAVLGETQLPPLFTGHLLPGDTQESGIFVTTGLFSSGCT